MTNVFATAARELGAGRPVAVASVARRVGSAPRSPGARCCVLAGGETVGTVGGGALEHRVQQAARRCLEDGRARYLEARLDAREAARAGMVCGGALEVLVVPWGPERAPVAEAAAALLEGRGRGVLVTAWTEGGRGHRVGLWTEGGWLGEPFPAAALPADSLEALLPGSEPLVQGGAEEGLLAEPLGRTRPVLVVLGAGHVGRALTRAAAAAGFAVTVVDDRAEFADPAQCPEAERVWCRPLEGALGALGVDEETFVVICTRGHLADARCTEEALRTPAPYVGVIGSRRKREATLERLRAAGVPPARLGALRMPVGLPLGAETPEEIAAAVVAELIQVRRGAAPPPLEADPEAGTLAIGGQRYLLLRPDTLGPLCRSPEPAVQALLEQGGREGGALAARGILERGFSGRPALEALLASGAGLGWGRFRLETWEPDEIRVGLAHSPFAQGAGPSEAPVCHPVRGVLAGMAEVLTGRPAAAEETACAARGEPECRFRVRLAGGTEGPP
ncbi:MAG: hypothetical protein Kow0092_15590 [Deferrisomatales bacterium]